MNTYEIIFVKKKKTFFFKLLKMINTVMRCVHPHSHLLNKVRKKKRKICDYFLLDGYIAF